VRTITTYRKVGAFYIACNGDLSPTIRRSLAFPFGINRLGWKELQHYSTMLE